MRNRERRRAPVVLVVVSSLACVAHARAQEKPVPPGWTCDVRKVLMEDSTRKPKVGDAVTEQEDETATNRFRDLDETGTPVMATEEQTVTHYERVRHLVAQDEAAKTSEVQFRYVSWKRKKKSGEDTSLEGKIVVVRHSGSRPTVVVVRPDGTRARVSDDAMAWIHKEHGSAKKAVSDEDERKLSTLAPEKPVGADSEWSGDPKILSDTIFEGAPIVAEKSSAKGRLAKVRHEESGLFGTVTFDVKIQLQNVPDTKVEWGEGGLIEMLIEHDGPVDDVPSWRSDERMKMHLSGKVKSPSGGQVREIDVKAESTRKRRGATAPEAVKLAFDPDADWRWDFRVWGRGEEPGTPEVGDRSFLEIETLDTSHVTVNGRSVQDTEKTLSARVEFEVTAVAEKKESERRATVVRWKLTEDRQVDDSLEGKTVVLALAPGGRVSWQVLDASGKKVNVSANAKQFIEAEMIRVRPRGLQLDSLHELLGPEPLAPEKEVPIDPAAAVTKLFGPGQEPDANTSKCSAKLTGVRLVAGDHEGKLEAHLALKLKTVPGAPSGSFEDPADCDVHFGFEGSLDRSRTGTGTTTITLDYTGRGTILGQAGPVNFEPDVHTKRSIRTGSLPRAAQPAKGSGIR